MEQFMTDQIFNFDIDKQWDYENAFYITSHSTRIAKLLAHYELYKTITNLPGHIVECGVFKGTSLIRFATFRDALESPFSRKIIGFDAFGKFPRQTNEGEEDTEFIDDFESSAGIGISVEELSKSFKHKSFENYELVKGDVLETIPQYLEKHPELKISLLHIDVDVYKPTKCILENLFDRVVTGGLIVFDDYGTVPGETKAVDEFFARDNIKIEKLGISHIPTFYRKK